MPARIDGYLPIEDYGAIGDGRSLALIGADGSLDWMCLPDLDGPSVFASLLDPDRGGRFCLRPQGDYTTRRRYLERTNVLETEFDTAQGKVRVLEAMTLDKSQTAPWREVVREVRGLAGQVEMVWHFEPRFEYGQRAAELAKAGEALVASAGKLALALQTWDAGTPEAETHWARGSFSVREGESAILALQAAYDEPLPLPPRQEVERRLEETIEVWRAWVERQLYQGPWLAAVERSLLAIRLLADGRTGAIAAAGTSSLPEVLDGQRNYDYRFGWVRDLSFTLDALLDVGLGQLTQASVSWLLHSTRATHPRVNPVYALDGSVVRTQERLPLRGYRGTEPVHLGNNAGSQLQLGGFGDLLETVWRYVREGHVLIGDEGERLADMADLLCAIWSRPDAGLWELADYAQYTTSKVSCWTFFDRLLDLVERGQVPARRVRAWRTAREELRTFVESRLWSEQKRSYRFKAGSEDLDCGTLLLSRRQFCDPRGERMQGTIAAISKELRAGPALFYRYSGMQEEEHAFLACSFWMVEALAGTGRLDEAAELMEGAVNLASPLGLYSEEMEPASQAMRGNFPQALTHLALINAAVALAESSSSSGGAPDQ